MSSSWIVEGPNPRTIVLRRNRKEHRETWREEGHVKTEADIEFNSHKPRNM